MNRAFALGGALALTLLLVIAAPGADEPQVPGRAPANLDIEEILAQAQGGSGGVGRPGGGRYRDFNELTKGAEKTEGLFTVHKKDDHLYAEIKPFQFDQPLLVPVTIAKGIAQAGMPVGNGEMVIVFHKVGDKVQVISRNIRYKAPAGTPIDKSVKQNYVDSILMALPIVAMNPQGGMSTVIDFSDIFLTNFAELPFGYLDRSRSGWHRVKGFPSNLELEVELTFGGGGRRSMMGGGDGVADSRGTTLVVHYSLLKAPDAGYRTRTADDRVGHFLNTQKDFGITSPDNNYVRYINRWRLEKADPSAKLSPPKKQIVWYIEDTVPVEYRPYVEEGIREWNKAFEKIGYKDAIAVRWQTEGRDEFDPEDTNYCTFRWVTTDAGFAMSCFRTNPMTGEIIDGDVVFDASFVRYWKQEYALLVGAAAQGSNTPMAVGEIVSTTLAAKRGFGQFGSAPLAGLTGSQAAMPELIPAEWGNLQYQLGKSLRQNGAANCQLRTGMTSDFAFAAMALANADEPKKTDEPKKPEDPKKPEEPKKKEPVVELPEEYLGQALKEVVMHEVGHSLGLRHNFKASTMLTADQLHDTEITRKRGLVGSVMDYCPVNLAPKGKKQGDYYTTTIGPYDYWAIEYAYKNASDDELKKIAARAPEHDLVYATDEDAAMNSDPLVNRFDMGADPCDFAKERIALAASLLKDLDQKVVKDGDNWSRNRRAFGILLSQYGNGADLVSSYIGGQQVSRDHKGDKDARDPVVPIPGDKQRECLKFLVENILSDKAFQFSPATLRRLGTEKWMDWSGSAFTAAVDFPVLQRVLAIQKIALAQCLDGGTLTRLQNQELQAEPNANPLKMDEIFRSLSDGIFAEVGNLPAADAKDKKLTLSTIRRNLQRDYLKRLSTMVLGTRAADYGDSFAYVMFSGTSSTPPDAKALARMHLRQIAEKVGKALETKDLAIDDLSRAHLEEVRHKVDKVLNATVDSNEP